MGANSAKGLLCPGARSIAICHPERSERPRIDRLREALRFAQNDSVVARVLLENDAPDQTAVRTDGSAFSR